MSSVGFTSQARDSELEKLREAYSSLKDVARGIQSALACIEAKDLALARAHLNAAKWHTEQAKKSIAVVGSSQKPKGQPLSCPPELVESR